MSSRRVCAVGFNVPFCASCEPKQRPRVRDIVTNSGIPGLSTDQALICLCGCTPARFVAGRAYGMGVVRAAFKWVTYMFLKRTYKLDDQRVDRCMKVARAATSCLPPRGLEIQVSNIHARAIGRKAGH